MGGLKNELFPYPGINDLLNRWTVRTTNTVYGIQSTNVKNCFPESALARLTEITPANITYKPPDKHRFLTNLYLCNQFGLMLYELEIKNIKLKLMS